MDKSDELIEKMVALIYCCLLVRLQGSISNLSDGCGLFYDDPAPKHRVHGLDESSDETILWLSHSDFKRFWNDDTDRASGHHHQGDIFWKIAVQPDTFRTIPKEH